MKRNICILLLLIFLMFVQSSILSANDFTVLSINGKVLIKTKNSKKWENVKIGNKVSKDDQLKIEKNSYIGMVHTNGRTEEIQKEGTYKVSDLIKNVSSKKSNITQRFTKYVINEIGSAEDMISRTSYKTQMGTTGAVTRAASGEDERIDNIVVLFEGDSEDAKYLRDLSKFSKDVKESTLFTKLPRDSYVIDSRITFSWYKKSGSKKYDFLIEDVKGNIVFEKSTANTELLVDLKEAGLNKGDNYYWSVKSGDMKSSEQCIHWLDLNNNPQLKEDLVALNEELSYDPKALYYLSSASYYGDMNIMHKAIEYFEKALSLAPSIDDYKRVYASYLFRIGLDDEAFSVLRR